MKTLLARGADALTIVVGVVCLIVLVPMIGARDGSAPDFGEAAVVGATVELPGVDLSGVSLVMFLASDCVFCHQSIPFHARLIDEARDDVQIVVVAPANDTGIDGYLVDGGIIADAVVRPGPGGLPVRGTPTLLFVENGVVQRSWIGLLDAGRAAQVLEVVG